MNVYVQGEVSKWDGCLVRPMEIGVCEVCALLSNTKTVLLYIIEKQKVFNKKYEKKKYLFF